MCYFCVATKRSDRAHTERRRRRRRRRSSKEWEYYYNSSNRQFITHRLSLYLLYYILQTPRESTGSFSTRTNPLCASFGHCAQHFGVLSYYMASHAYRRFIFTNKSSSRRVYFSSPFFFPLKIDGSFRE